jgi:hypothetical protein
MQHHMKQPLSNEQRNVIGSKGIYKLGTVQPPHRTISDVDTKISKEERKNKTKYFLTLDMFF